MQANCKDVLGSNLVITVTCDHPKRVILHIKTRIIFEKISSCFCKLKYSTHHLKIIQIFAKLKKYHCVSILKLTITIFPCKSLWNRLQSHKSWHLRAWKMAWKDLTFIHFNSVKSWSFEHYLIEFFNNSLLVLCAIMQLVILIVFKCCNELTNICHVSVHIQI